MDSLSIEIEVNKSTYRGLDDKIHGRAKDFFVSNEVVYHRVSETGGFLTPLVDSVWFLNGGMIHLNG